MVPTRPSRTPLLRSAVLALVLVSGTVAVAVGRDASTDGGPARPVDGRLAAPAVVAALPAVAAPDGSEPGPRYDGRVRDVTPALDRSSIDAPTPRLYPVRAVGSGRSGGGTGGDRGAGAGPSGYHGRNHVWMPSLGISRSVSFYGCSNASYPGNRVYRWGCGGRNNVYLFGHAGSVFKPLHDAYVRGRLRKGAPLYYADGSGHVHAYRVSWWKLTTATKGTWAYQSLSAPSLTLQTCIGAQSQYRLIVRLTEVG